MNRPRILVVDNDENILSAFEDYLSKKNCSMVAASTVETGIKKMKQQNFDILITDVRENSNYGTKFIMLAKKLQPNIRVIAITSYPDKISEANLKMNGADFLFVKPLDLKKLDRAVNSCLQLSGRKIS